MIRFSGWTCSSLWRRHAFSTVHDSDPVSERPQQFLEGFDLNIAFARFDIRQNARRDLTKSCVFRLRTAGGETHGFDERTDFGLGFRNERRELFAQRIDLFFGKIAMYALQRR
jgi:hypothetical protein